jgi:cytidylate kinase
VRLTAPLDDRIAYMSQWLRLSMEAAAQQVATRDRRRAEFLETHFQRRPSDVYQYDLILNTSLLGEELCADLIAHAARSKMAARLRKHEARDS